MNIQRIKAFMRAAAFAGIGAIVPSCGLFGDDLGTVSLPMTINVNQELPIVYPSSQQLSSFPVNNNQEYEWPIQLFLSVDLSEFNNDLGKYDIIDALVVRSVEMTITENSLEGDIQPIEFRIGAPGAVAIIPGVEHESYTQALPIANSDLIPRSSPLFTGKVNMDIVEQNQAATGELVAEFTAGIGVGTLLVFPKGSIPPGGLAKATFKIKMDVQVKFL